jgi:hypothetical protein
MQKKIRKTKHLKIQNYEHYTKTARQPRQTAKFNVAKVLQRGNGGTPQRTQNCSWFG